jgi:hypothetical protein
MGYLTFIPLRIYKGNHNDIWFPALRRRARVLKELSHCGLEPADDLPVAQIEDNSQIPPTATKRTCRSQSRHRAWSVRTN